MTYHYPYLIIGGGMTGDAAARGIRQVDTEQAIGLIGLEPDPPYNRPPLSKGLWKAGARPMPLSRIMRGTASLRVDLHLGRKVVSLDPAGRVITDDQGDIYTFKKLLLATGGDPIRLGPDHERVIYYRTLADYHRLRALTEHHNRFAVIGGGFIGSEMAAVLANLGKQVTIIFPEPGIGWRVLPEALALHLMDMFRARDIDVRPGRLVEALQPDEEGVTVILDNEQALRVDAVIAGLGIRPNTSLAEQASLTIANGIHVNEYLQTSHPDIYAAGDVANFYSPVLEKRMRVEHEENANLTGQLAGMAMAGRPAPYHQLPSVYSTLFDLNYDAVGDLDPRLEILYDWQEPFQKGSVYYMSQGRVRGVLLWNIPRGLDTARQLIAEPGPFQPADLTGRISA